MSFGIARSKRGYAHLQVRFVNTNPCWSWFVRLVPTAALVAAAACSPHAENVTADKLPTPVASVLVSLVSGSITVGQTTRASAVAKDSSGNTLANLPITWASSNSAVATITDSGLTTGIGVGTSRISATSEGQTGSVVLVVSAAPPAPVATVTVALGASSVTVGQSTQATVTLKDANGNTLTGRTVTWGSNNTAVATVSSSGLVNAVAAGSAQITATSEGQSGSATLTVTVAPVATVTVALNAPSISPGQSTQATATLKDANGNTLTGRTVTWASNNTAVATVSTSGLVNAIAVGTAQITATSEGKSGSATLTVAVAPVATVTVALASSSLLAGQSTQATATLKDANGNTLTGRTVTWASNNTAVATVSSSGLVNAIAVGSAQITATSEGQSGSASLSVTSPPPPPPPGTCPSPVTPDIATWGFDDGTWGPYQPVDGSTEQIVADATATGGHDVRVIYHTTTGNGMAGGVTKRFDAQANQKMYVRFAYKQDPTFDNSGIKKYTRFQGPGYNGLFGTLINDHNRFNWVWDGDSQDTYTNVGSEITPDQLRGAWHWYEILNDISASGALHMRFWIDGVLKMDYTRATSNRGFMFGAADVMGVFNAPSANGTDWIDEVSMSRQCIDLQ